MGSMDEGWLNLCSLPPLSGPLCEWHSPRIFVMLGPSLWYYVCCLVSAAWCLLISDLLGDLRPSDAKFLPCSMHGSRRIVILQDML